jgi:hypothetical protein
LLFFFIMLLFIDFDKVHDKEIRISEKIKKNELEHE